MGEYQYGIEVRNKFALDLSDEDEDPLDVLRRQEQVSKEKKPDKSKKDVKNEKTAKSAKNKLNKKETTQEKEKFIENIEPKKEEKPRRFRQNEDRSRTNNEINRDSSARTARRGFNRDGPGFVNRESGFNREDRPQQSGENRFRGPQFSETREGGERGRGRGGGGRGRGGRGRGGDRGGRGGFDRFGKREFERHSGSDRTSGVKSQDKREGGGAHNWGTVQDDLEEQLNNTNVSEENQEWGASPTAAEGDEQKSPKADAGTEGEGDVTNAVEPEDVEPKEMTLDEWKAMQTKEKKSVPTFNIRRANEGSDDASWKKMHQLRRKVEEEESEEEEDEDEEDEERRNKRNVVPIEITFNDNPRRGGGRGRGRGGDRGRGRGGDRDGGERSGGGRSPRGRGGFGVPRGGRGGFRRESGEAAPNVQDENDFPSLGKPAAS